MKTLSLALACLAVLAHPAHAGVQRCIGMTPDSARLACFDSEVKLAPVRVSSASAKRVVDCPVAEAAAPLPVYVQVPAAAPAEPVRTQPASPHRH